MNLYKLNFGLIPTIPDERDYTAKTFGIEPSGINEKIELDLPSFVYNQMQTGMCAAFSSSMMLSMINNTEVKFSKSDIYAQKRSGGEGASLRDIMNILRKRGACPELLYDHTGSFEECKQVYNMYKDEADYMAELGRIRHYYKAETEEDVVSALKLGKPLLAGISIHENFVPVGDSIPLPDGEFLGQHAILIVGHKPGYVKILNSWGLTWGDDGTAWIPYSMIELAYVPVDSNMKIQSVYFKIGQKYYTKNGKEYEMDVAPKLEDGRTWIPLRFVAESLDAEVTWYPNIEGIGIVK